MKKKIIFFDIDGTLYSYKDGIPADTIEAVRLLKEKGHIPVLCTGRTKSMIFQDMFQFNMNALIAGAGTCLEIEGNILYQYEMPDSQARELISDMIKFHIIPIGEGIDYMYYPLSDKYAVSQRVFEIYHEEMGEAILDINTKDQIRISKISGKVLEDSRLDLLEEKYEDIFKIVVHDDTLVELIPKPYSKAMGIQRLLEYIEEKNPGMISWEDTYAYGDSMNDFEMLQYVKYGVAMGNSRFELKHKTKYVTEAYNQGGIYNSLKRFGLI